MTEDEGNLIHGFSIDLGEHHHAGKYMESHMSQEQVREMVHRAENGHSAHFMVVHDGQHKNFKIEDHGGKLKIHEAHHSSDE